MTDIRSTYRLQITPEFTLFDAAAVCDYLAALGVDCAYLSPILTSTPGSNHGYDCVDPTTIDPQRGGEEGWAAFVAAARAAGLKIVIDIVPNHQGIEIPRTNPAWWDVLKHGRDSRYASWFDIDWSRAPIAVPILAPEATPEDFTIDGDVLRYYEHEFPLAPGSAQPGDAMADVLERQHYRLLDWRVANSALNYRRFFAVGTLAGVRVEDPDVYAATHTRIMKMLEDGELDGLRVDHPDGLVAPGDYLTQLRSALGEDRWLIGEKILGAGEPQPLWPSDGTVGYDAMREVSEAFVDPDAEPAATARYTDISGDFLNAHDHELRGKTEVAVELFGAELHRLAALVPELETDRVRHALLTLAAHFNVYRTYLPDDAHVLEAALDRAAAASVEDAMTLSELAPRLRNPEDELALRFQQLTGAVTAKGVEDTAFYRYNRFVALNEVGGAPWQFGVDLDEFHELQQMRQDKLAQSMTGLSTHDTKRGEDTRAHMIALTDVDVEWDAFAREFVRRSDIPSQAFAYLLAQTFAGVGPIERERMHAYAEKAMREAHDGTSWGDPDEDFEARVHAAIELAYDDPELRAQWDALRETIEPLARVISLGQKIVQLTMPGIPDVYQGTEIWEDSLVDPDNRRPVNYDRLRELPTEAPEIDETGRAKQWLVSRVLHARREHPEKFTSYAPVYADGPAARHALAFDRGGMITVATRIPGRLAADGGWRDTTLALTGEWTELLTGRRGHGPVALAELLDRYPVALLDCAGEAQ